MLQWVSSLCRSVCSQFLSVLWLWLGDSNGILSTHIDLCQLPHPKVLNWNICINKAAQKLAHSNSLRKRHSIKVEVRCCKHTVTCSVIKTEKLRYFLLMLVPSVTKRMRKMHSVRHHKTSSQLPRWSTKLLASCSSWNHNINITIIVKIFTAPKSEKLQSITWQ